MKAYSDYIKNLAKEGKNEIFFNSGPDHAALVMATIFDNAKEYVKIYAANFSGEISGQPEYQAALGNFLMRGGKLQILLQKEKYEALNNKPSLFKVLRFFSTVNKDQITVKKHPYKLKEKSGGPEIHFTVADDKMFRVEEDINNFTAKGNFNNSQEAKTLSTLFDGVWSKEDAEKIEF